ncbi:MAG TPA: tetratricopeptide repeat protein, partial [Polyangiaceae bacterium]|nr:tetratricopeptide repeat protein [Polyangiaceae bacterium]
MNKRLAYLEQLVGSGRADSFARYALGMEYRKEERPQDAMDAFQALRDADPDYLAAYLMVGQVASKLEDFDTAREWLETDKVLAAKQNDSKALDEI